MEVNIGDAERWKRKQMVKIVLHGFYILCRIDGEVICREGEAGHQSWGLKEEFATLMGNRKRNCQGKC